MKFGIQLYGLNEICNENAEKLFEGLKSYGYTMIEPCFAVDHDEIATKGWPKSKIDGFMSMAACHGLSVSSCHILTQDYEAAIDLMVGYAKKYNIGQFVWGLPHKDEVQAFVAICTKAAKKLRAVNAELLIHNGPNEISDKMEGKSVYEWFLKQCNGAVYAEPDVGWIVAGGGNPETFLRENNQYIKSIHYKDMKMALDGSYSECALGCGVVDIDVSFKVACRLDIPHIIDQDISETDIMMDIKNSVEYLLKLA